MTASYVPDDRQESLDTRSLSLESTLTELTTERTTLMRTLASLPSMAAFLPRVIAHASTSNHSQASNENGAAAARASIELHDNGESASTTPNELDEEATLAAAKAIIKRHISLLHTYNEIRDIGQGLMGLISDSRGVRIKEVQEEFGVDAKD